MNEKPRQVKKRHVRGLIIFLTLFFVFSVFTVFYVIERSKHAVFVYADHLDEAVLTIDGTDVTLREFGYYIHEMEGYVQRQALIYDPDDPKKYWNTHYSAGMDSTYMFDYAKKTALANCVFDHVYANDARGEGMLLSPEGTEKAETETGMFFSGVSAAQREITGLTQEIVLDTEMRKALAAEYIRNFASREDVSGYGGTPAEVLSYDGAYYRQVILPKHTVEYHEDLIDHLRFGTITVNRAA